MTIEQCEIEGLLMDVLGDNFIARVYRHEIVLRDDNEPLPFPSSLPVPLPHGWLASSTGMHSVFRILKTLPTCFSE